MKFFSFSGEMLIKALNWTFVHSLWQGILLSLVASAIIILTKRAKPSLRYNLLVTALIAFSVGVVATFITQLEINKEVLEPALNTLQTNNEESNVNLITMHAIQSKHVVQITNFINNNAVWFMSIWLLVFVFKFIGLSNQLYNVYQLKHKHNILANEYWIQRINVLCQKLKINKKVSLLQSSIVTIPSVIGYFKPIILFPAAMLTSLPVDEVEAILIHELGHIRRNDFVVNLLQNILEIVFFFNPAIIWVSSLIKTERENCCDDIVVNFTGNKKDYIKALIRFLQLEQQHNQAFATAFTGEKNHLLSRVKRMVYNNNKSLNNMEKKFLSASLVLLSVCFFAFASNVVKDDKKAKLWEPIVGSEEMTTNHNTVISKLDSIPVYKIEGNSNWTGIKQDFIDGKEYKIIIKNSIVTDMYIDGQQIPSEKIINYKYILDQQLELMVRDGEQAVRDSEQAMKDSERAARDSEQAMRDSEQAVRDSEQAMRDSDQAMKDSEQAARDSEQAMRDGEQAVRDSEQAMRDSEQAMKDSEQAMRDSEQAKRDSEQAARDSEQAARDSEQAIRDSEQAMKDQKHALRDQEQSRRKMQKVIQELINDSLIRTSEELYSFNLTSKKLKINGVIQPSNIHQKYLEKYGKHLGNNGAIIYEAR